MDSSKGIRVKNRAPAPIQITAEQILLEARDRAGQQQPPAPKRHVADVEELAEHRMRSRKEFEDRLRMNRTNVAVWLRYAKWEEGQKEIDRARSIYERALDVDYKNVQTWIRYAEMEMRNKFINRARNVWDRAVSLLPRVETFWYKYTYMEEMLGNVAGARILFERWMGWEPDEQAWLTYIKFEQRQNAIDRARGVYERYVATRPEQLSYLRYAKWEERGNNQRALARRVYERAMDELRDDEKDAALYSSFAKFEERCGEEQRARLIYKFGLEKLAKDGKDKDSQLYKDYVVFEKTHGDRAGIEDVIVNKRRESYEASIVENPLNYDVWFDYSRMEEAEASNTGSSSANSADSAKPGVADGRTPNLRNAAKIRDVYERAVSNIPPIPDKRYWRRYLYLWLNYTCYEELTACDVNRARAVYRAALAVIPHRSFTFGKLWIMAAHFEIRQKDAAAARRLLGQAIGMCPKENVIRGYIDLELQLGEIDRCRTLYEKYLTLFPSNVGAWTRFADLERSLGEDDRARAIYELAVSQRALDMPEVAWKSYIDFEIELGQLDNARTLYARLLQRTGHAKVWLSFAAFEASVAGDADAARAVYERGYKELKSQGDDGKEHRALVVESWRAFEDGLLTAAMENLQLLQQQQQQDEGDNAASDGNGDGDGAGSSSSNASSEQAAIDRANAVYDAEQAVNEQRNQLATIDKKLPRKVKKRRAVYANGRKGPVPSAINNDSSGGGPGFRSGRNGIGGDAEEEQPVAFEEYWDYIFPDDESKPAHLKLLELAHKWKQAAAAAGGGAGASATAMLESRECADEEAAAAATKAAAGRASSSSGLVGYEDENEIDLDAEDGGDGAGAGSSSSAAGGRRAAAGGDENEIDLDALDDGGDAGGSGSGLAGFLSAAVGAGGGGAGDTEYPRVGTKRARDSDDAEGSAAAGADDEDDDGDASKYYRAAASSSSAEPAADAAAVDSAIAGVLASRRRLGMSLPAPSGMYTSASAVADADGQDAASGAASSSAGVHHGTPNDAENRTHHHVDAAKHPAFDTEDGPFNEE